LLASADELIEKCRFDSASHFAQKAIEESRSKKFMRGEAYARLKLGEIHYNKSDFAPAGALDSAALKIGAQIKDTGLIALSHYQLGQLLLENQQYQEAEQLFQKALALKYEKEQSEYTGYIYNDLGILYGEKGFLEQRLNWLLKAVRIHQKNENEFGLAQTYSNLNDYYYDLDKFDQAIAYGKLSFQIREKLNDYAGLANSGNNLSQTYLRIDSVQAAVKYQEAGLKYATLSGLPSRIAHSYVSMSLLMNRQKKIKEALEYEKKAIAIYETVDRNVQSNRFIAAAFYSNMLNDSAGAVEYFKKSESLARELNDKIVLRNVNQYMSDFYRARKNMQLAYDYQRKYYSYRDSLNNVEVNKKISELQTQYETEKKDYEIKKLTSDQKIRELEIERQNAIIAGNLSVAKQKENEIELLSRFKELQQLKIKQQDEQLERQLLVAKNSKQQLELAEKEKLLQSRKLKDEKTTRNILLLSFILILLTGFFLFNRYQLKRKIKEQEALLSVREKIAKDLHDEIGSTLTGIRIMSDVTGKIIHNDQSKASGLLQKISHQSSEMQQAMSDIVWAVNPNNDKLQDIIVRMREYVAQTLEAKDITTRIDIDESILAQKLDMSQRRDLLLIFKEAINNIAKYANASQVDIQFSKQQEQLALHITDNGKGFDTSVIRSSNGLKNMQSRAMALKGICAIKSELGKGTQIHISIPCSSA
jgi:signal transduction histidine kinase